MRSYHLLLTISHTLAYLTSLISLSVFAVNSSALLGLAMSHRRRGNCSPDCSSEPVPKIIKFVLQGLDAG